MKNLIAILFFVCCTSVSAQQKDMIGALTAKPELLIFLNAKTISRADFVEYMKQAYDTKSTIVLKGFISEGASAMLDTQKYIVQLNEDACHGKCPASVSILPKLFEYYQIQAVPSFVLALPDYKNEKIAPKDAYVKYTDLVPIDYVLKLFSERATNPALRKQALQIYNQTYQ